MIFSEDFRGNNSGVVNLDDDSSDAENKTYSMLLSMHQSEQVIQLSDKQVRRNY